MSPTRRSATSRKASGKLKGRERQHQEALRRTEIETRWNSRVTFAHELAYLAVQSPLEEPLHRWLPYRQGFSPELVRRFLNDGEPAGGPILDPFSGSGTTVIECARQNVRAVGVEAVPSLVFVTNARLASDKPPLAKVELPEGGLAEAYQRLAPAQELERAAILIAAARTLKGDGKQLKTPADPAQLLAEAVAMIEKDRNTPILPGNTVMQGDARNLPFEGGSIGGILTSPPYLSRYDYTKVNSPMETIFSGGKNGEGRSVQIRAHGKARAQKWTSAPHPAAEEACEHLRERGCAKSAGVVRSYFDDMRAVLAECARVLKPGAPLLLVAAGARVEDEYVPADLVLADICEELGLVCEEILRVRFFGAGRILGRLENIAPREMLMSFRKA